MEKPLWLLDVDGVLNAVNVIEDLQALEQDTNWPDYQVGRADGGRRPGHTFQIIWSPTLVKRMVVLVEADLVEIRWLTTWEGRAQTEIAPLLGLPHFELAGERNFEAEYRAYSDRANVGDYWWKFPIARAAVEDTPQRALIWSDDDLPAIPEASEWARERWKNGGGQACLVSPRFDLGISPRQMEAIEQFIENNQ
jgi:hypothetical protein